MLDPEPDAGIADALGRIVLVVAEPAAAEAQLREQVAGVGRAQQAEADRDHVVARRDFGVVVGGDLGRVAERHDEQFGNADAAVDLEQHVGDLLAAGVELAPHDRALAAEGDVERRVDLAGVADAVDDEAAARGVALGAGDLDRVAREREPEADVAARVVLRRRRRRRRGFGRGRSLGLGGSDRQRESPGDEQRDVANHDPLRSAGLALL